VESGSRRIDCVGAGPEGTGAVLPDGVKFPQDGALVESYRLMKGTAMATRIAHRLLSSILDNFGLRQAAQMTTGQGIIRRQ